VESAACRPRPLFSTAGNALVTAASGVGDIVRVTPLIRVIQRLGYQVDVLLAPDDPAAPDLLRGASEIRHLLSIPQGLGRRARPEIDGLAGERYELATFTHLSAPLRRCVDARGRYTFDGAWRSDGDSACVERVARAIGWQGELPAPFAMKSHRRFGLPRDTIALHPGCKPNWPWKKWHGFDELAGLFPNVAVVGTAADVDNSGTYFDRPFSWPEHVHEFTGRLDLRDTAALLSQCAALVSLDSGIMHLGVALGVPTFGIFGITSPERECIPSPHMVPIHKQLACAAACRANPWGRRDCEGHLACLKTLTAQEVAARVVEARP
jgi:ADP-heptose:LPS heptosyltransferase